VDWAAMLLGQMNPTANLVQVYTLGNYVAGEIICLGTKQSNGEEAGGYALSDDERRIFIGYHCPQAARYS
jgi:hypothetical protein